MTEEITEPKPKKKYKKNYINNADFTAAIAEWVAGYKQEKAVFIGEKGTFIGPPMSNYIGECFMKLVEGCAKKPNFSGYTYIDEMKSEALLTCMKYAHNFNVEKSNNAFGYFTQYIINSFKGVLNAEKRISVTKFGYIKQLCDTSDHYDYKQIMFDDTEQGED
jgi:hypothetical protein